MNPIYILLSVATLFIPLASCTNQQKNFDASGSFEAEETIISSEVSGTIKQLNVEEGQNLQAGQTLGYIDSIQLYLKKKQLTSQINALLSKKPDIAVQLAVLKERLKTAEKEKIRINNLVKSDAATTKQLDDINANIDLLNTQIEAQKSSLEISSEGISSDVMPFYVQREQINDLLAKHKIINPIKGTVLAKYAEAHEMTSMGKPLYKIADISTLILRTYVTGNQLPLIKLNQKVTVHTDNGEGGFKETEGLITWINDKAEFTPKTIQTKDERANMVYAVKVKVNNDGSYKIGMYGEIKFR